MIKLELMRNDPVVWHEGDPIKIKGVQRQLFRLLVLHEGRTVSYEDIARLTDSATSTAGSKIRYVKDDLGPLAHLVINDRGTGYSIALDNCYVDAIEFRQGVGKILTRSFDPFIDRMEPDEALREVEVLDSLIKLWDANPAVDLPVAEALWQKFESLYDDAANRLVHAQLFSREEAHIKRAISALESAIRSGRATMSTWRLLLLAYDALGAEIPTSKLVIRIADFYRNKVPEPVESTMAAVFRDPQFKNPFELLSTKTCEEEEGPSAVVPEGNLRNPKPNTPRVVDHDVDTQSVTEICRVLGITTTSHLSLANSQLEPEACIRRTRQRLWFSGVLASKWVSEAWVWHEFDQLLTRLDTEKGDVRFMMINPKGKSYERLTKLRDGHISDKSVEPMKQLAAAHTSLQVRVFDSLPSFRIVIIDDDVVSFSPYRLGADAYLAADRGWEAPHVVLDPMAPYALAEAFTLLFSETWNNATPIEDI